jgi:hypothetical protein
MLSVGRKACLPGREPIGVTCQSAFLPARVRSALLEAPRALAGRPSERRCPRVVAAFSRVLGEAHRVSFARADEIGVGQALTVGAVLEGARALAETVSPTY